MTTASIQALLSATVSAGIRRTQSEQEFRRNPTRVGRVARLTRDEHFVPQRGSFELRGPHRKRTTRGDSSAGGNSLPEKCDDRESETDKKAADGRGPVRCLLRRYKERSP